MPYAIDVKHDGQLYHLEIPELRIPKCRACGELVFSNRVDDQVRQALRKHMRLLTPEQIKGGRNALGLKSKEFAEKLGVAAETISRWEGGGLIQSRAMDNLLRVYFAVPEVRKVLQGTQQDLALGTKLVPDVDPPPPPPRPTLQDAFRTQKVRELAKQEASPRWTPFPPGDN
jgi:putative zinc finger/helix-turn-helix YgiT family protein